MWKEVHLPCPNESCGSSDAFCIDYNNWGHCFSCGGNFPPDTLDHKEEREERKYDLEEYKFIPHRGISESTFEFFDVSTRVLDGIPVEVGFKYPNGSVKVRSFNEKKFHTVGKIQDGGFFGLDKFESGGDTLVIVEGEYDVLATYDMTRLPVITCGSAQALKRAAKKDFDKVNSFKKIVVCFDNDDPGQKATSEFSRLFDFHKVFYCNLTLKDPNQYLEDGKVKEFIEAVSSAKKYSPDNIIHGFNEIAESLIQSHSALLGTYPFRDLENALHGLRRGDLVVFKGPTGIGKTEIFRSMESHLLKEDPEIKMALLHLEEDQGTTVKALATYGSGYPYVRLTDTSSIEDVMKDYIDLVKTEDRVYIYESFDVEDEATLFSNLRFLITQCGVSLIFLDHITWLATGRDSDDDERRKLDRISQKLKLLAKELDVCICIISHTNDDGKTRGSRNVANAANTIIHLERDKTSPSDDVKNRTYFTVEKGRGGGTRTGPAGYAVYDEDSLTLKNPETNESDTEEREEFSFDITEE